MTEKVALVTGASAGIGAATAARLAKAGYVVYASARRVERMEGLKPLGVKVLKMDVTDDAALVAGVETIIREAGRLDVLVNNAGYGSYGALEDVPLSEGKYQFEVNVFGLARLIQLVLPQMRQQRCGKIVNVTSIGGKIHEPLGSWYHATKFAVEGMSDCLRMEVKGFGIDVIVVEPGAIKTEWADIARENLLKTSGAGAYAALAERSANYLAAAPKMASDPDGIAKVIEQAVAARRPRTRYAAGTGAGLSLFMRKLLPDRAMDSFMEMVIKTAAGMKK